MMLDKRKRINKFNLFVQNLLPLSSRYDATNIELANSKYDAFVVGSDQVWNLRVTGNDMNYFLQFASDEKNIHMQPALGEVQKCLMIEKKK